MPTRKTAQYERWYAGLPDMRTRDRVDTRIGRLEAGNPGDVRPIGKGASELRLSFGPGYRVYYYLDDADIVLLNGGDKSTQRRDILIALSIGGLTMGLRKDVVTTPYDFAEYIESKDDVRVVLDAAFETNDASVITRKIGAICRSKGMATIAASTGLQREGLYKSLSETGNPELKTLLKILDALDLVLAIRPKRGARTRSAPPAPPAATPPRIMATGAPTPPASRPKPVSGSTRNPAKTEPIEVPVATVAKSAKEPPRPALSGPRVTSRAPRPLCPPVGER